MSSWAADIEQTRKTKNYSQITIGSGGENAPHPAKRLRNTHMSRDYDIVSFNPKSSTKFGFVVDTGVKPDAATRAASANPQAVNPTEKFHKGVEKTLKHAYHAFDCVTNKPVYGLSEQEATQRFPKDHKRGVRSIGDYHERNFDLVSNTALYGREEKFQAEEEEARSSHRVRNPPRQRQTDIVSHRYKEQHEERAARAKEDNKKLLDSRKKPTDFNPIAQKWCDPKVETEKTAQHVQKENEYRDAVLNHTYKVSSLVRHSEGHAVDFMTGKVHNPEFLLEIEKGNKRGMMQRTKLRQEFEHRRDMEEAVRDADVQLVKSRYHPSKRPEFAGGEKVPSTLARLDASMKSKASTTSDVFIAEGPRTTTERVLNTKPSEIAAAANTFEGRKMILLPTLAKARGAPLKREELISVLHHKK